ncbi:MAG: hypothetical protein AAB568_03025 [Patescibacteria group bacterium]
MSLTIPLSYLFIPVALFALIYVIFFLINLYHLVVYTTPSLTGFIMTFFFLGGAAYIIFISYNLLGGADWQQPLSLLNNYSVFQNSF